jgi:hypothetical protein
LKLTKDNVTYIPIARQLFGKHIHAEANERNNRTTIVRQRISKLLLNNRSCVSCVVHSKCSAA